MKNEDELAIEFPAALDREGSTAVFASIRYHRHDPSVLDIRAHLLASGLEKIEAHARLFQPEWNYFFLYGRSEKPQLVEVIGIRGAIGGDTVRSDASAIQIDISAHEESVSRRYHFTAQLTPSGILVQPRSEQIDRTGEIKSEVLHPGAVMVTYYEVAYFDTQQSPGSARGMPFFRRKLKTVTREEAADDLINFHDLVDGGFDRLYQAYRI
ncbi:MAG TPA: hypothetical protein VJ276_23570 [Thermoanaerobaculia bacterium]|nr:hypothetical protein [Thermoanaerobaculia bacterium]